MMPMVPRDQVAPYPLWTSEQLAAMSQSIARWLAAMDMPSIPESLQCCDYGADGCTGRAEESGWCAPCGVKLFPPRPFVSEGS